MSGALHIAGPRPAARFRAPGGTAGFTIVEFIIVLGLLAAVMGAAYSVYNLQYRVTHVEEEVVEVQQNLRVGMDGILKDLRAAGLLAPGGENPLDATSNGTGMSASDRVTINTASASLVYARVDVDLTTNVVAGGDVTFTVDSPDSLEFFSVGDVVRVMDSGEQDQPIDTAFTVSGIDTGVPSLTATAGANGTNIIFRRGNMIARIGDDVADPFPNTVLYCVGPYDAAGTANDCAPAVTTCPAGQACLMRVVNGTPDDDSVVATNMQGLEFRYIIEGSTAETDAPANLSVVRAVRVTLTGVTVETEALSGTAKTRELTSVVKLRNSAVFR
jgi:Tfp pilus assembly protein PilW